MIAITTKSSINVKPFLKFFIIYFSNINNIDYLYSITQKTPFRGVFCVHKNIYGNYGQATTPEPKLEASLFELPALSTHQNPEEREPLTA